MAFPPSICLKDDVLGKSNLICFSDGSELAFGTAPCIRWWSLASGGCWTSLITSKSRIAPKQRITITRLELNGSVLAKRLREFVLIQVDLEFGNVYHFVDSSTVSL